MENSLATVPTDAAAEREILDKARQNAAVILYFAEEELGRRAVEPTTSTKTLLDIAEHAYKVSGMASKQAEKPAGPGFSITIQLPGMDGASPTVIEMGSLPTDDFSALPPVPDYLLSDLDGNLA